MVAIGAEPRDAIDIVVPFTQEAAVTNDVKIRSCVTNLGTGAPDVDGLVVPRLADTRSGGGAGARAAVRPGTAAVMLLLRGWSIDGLQVVFGESNRFLEPVEPRGELVISNQ